MSLDASLLKAVNRAHNSIEVDGSYSNTSRARLTLSVSGNLDGHNSRDFTRTVYRILEAYPSAAHLVIDLRKLAYIASAGIGSFVQILIHCKEIGVRFTLYRPPQNVHNVFETLGLSQFFEIASEERELADDSRGERDGWVAD